MGGDADAAEAALRARGAGTTRVARTILDDFADPGSDRKEGAPWARAHHRTQECRRAPALCPPRPPVDYARACTLSGKEQQGVNRAILRQHPAQPGSTLGQRQVDRGPACRGPPGTSRSDELGYEEELPAEELPALDAACAWFTYVPIISRPRDDAEWSGETGRVEGVLRKHADPAELCPGHGAIYLCGHPEMISKSAGIMRRRGFGACEIREEQY
jgi:hypothetical protein